MWRTAVLAPTLVGANWTVKVVLPPGLTGAVGFAVTLNIAASKPSIVIPNPVRLALPVFLMVKVRPVLAPADTPSNDLLPPSGILVPTGCSTAISGEGQVIVTNP